MLTEKGIEVMKLRKKGLKQAEIARKLKISQPAISAFENNILRKVNDSISTINLIKGLGLESKLKKRGML